MTTGFSSAVQRRPDELIDILTADFQRRYEPNFAWKSAVSQFLAIPALVGFWPMSAARVDNAIDRARDMAGGAYHLVDNNGVRFGFDDLAPYAEFLGTNEYLSRADGGIADWADITGVETYVVPKQGGLTGGGWFYLDTLAQGNHKGFIGKYNDAAVDQRSYLLLFNDTTDVPTFIVSRLGTNATITAIDGPVLSASTWYFIVGRFTPGADVEIFVNGTWYSAGAGPASIFDSEADFNIGSYSNGMAIHCLDGRASLCFLSAAAVSNAIVGQLWQQSRAMYGM